MLQCKSMCVCWVSVDCEEPEPVTEQPAVTEASHDYKGQEEVNYQNAVSILEDKTQAQKSVVVFLLHNTLTIV